MRTSSPHSDLLEECLIGVRGNGVDLYLNEETEICAKVFNLVQPYLPRHQPREILNVEVRSSNEDKKDAP